MQTHLPAMMAPRDESFTLSTTVICILSIISALISICPFVLYLWWRRREKMRQRKEDATDDESDAEDTGPRIPLRRLLMPQPKITPTMYGVAAACFPIRPPQAVILDSRGQATGPRASMLF